MNIVCIGAHPDDCEVFAGGTAVKWVREGHRVLFVSMTNGDIGHHVMARDALAQRRDAEARHSAELAGVEALVLDYHDGELEPTLAARKKVTRIIREYRADAVLTHRSCDYHPDHRYTAVTVQDAAFLLTVPGFCPDIPRIERMPIVLHLPDTFTRPLPFRPDLAVDVTDEMPIKWDMLDAMESQFYEWLPWLDGCLAEVPNDKALRREWLRKAWGPFFLEMTNMGQTALSKWYGTEATEAVTHAEIFEISEYGRQPAEEDIRALFPFFS